MHSVLSPLGVIISTSSESESKCGSKKPTGHSSSSTAASAGIMCTDEDTATCSESYIGPQLYNAASVGAYSCAGPESTASQTVTGKFLFFLNFSFT